MPMSVVHGLDIGCLFGGMSENDCSNSLEQNVDKDPDENCLSTFKLSVVALNTGIQVIANMVTIICKK